MRWTKGRHAFFVVSHADCPTLIAIFTTILPKPPDMDTFLQAMSAAGYEIKQGRGGTINLRTEGQERFTRLRASTLGKGYGQEDIQAAIECGTTPQERRKVNLIVDIRSRMRAGKGPAYER